MSMDEITYEILYTPPSPGGPGSIVYRVVTEQDFRRSSDIHVNQSLFRITFYRDMGDLVITSGAYPFPSVTVRPFDDAATE